MRFTTRLLIAGFFWLIASDTCFGIAVQNSPSPAVTQNPAPNPAATPVPSVTPADELAKLRAEFQAATDLDEPKKIQIENGLKIAEQAIARSAELDQLVTVFEELPPVTDQRKTLERQIEAWKQSESQVPEIPADIALLSNQISTAQDKVAQLKKLVAESDNEPSRRITRREEIRIRELAIETESSQLESLTSSLPDADTSLAARTRRFRVGYQKKNLERETALIKAELARFDAEEKEEILRLQRELYRGQLAQQQSLLSRLEAARSDQEKKAAAQASSEAKKQQAAIENRNPLLVKSYEVNTGLAQQNEKFVQRSAAINKELGDLKKRLESLQRQFTETETMIDQVGLSGSVGELLRQRKNDLPNSQYDLNKSRETKLEVQNIQFQLFDITRRQTELTRETIENEILKANPSTPPASLASLATQIETLLNSRKEILDASKRNVRSLFESLVDMEYRYRTYANVTQDYRDYLNERIFWIKSNNLLFSEFSLDESDHLLLQARRWEEVQLNFGKLITESPLLIAVLVFGLLGLITLRPRLREEVREMGQTAARGACDTFWPSLRTLFATCLLAIVVPFPLLFVGFMIQQSPLNDGSSLFASIGTALLSAGLFALPIEFLRHVCRDGGLAHKHLSWSNDAVSILKHNLGWLSPVGTLIVFVISLLQKLDLSHRVDLIERLFFVAGMVCLFIFLRRCLSPRDGIFSAYLNLRPRSWASQTSSLWFGVILFVPIFLAFLAIWGYYYTTISLATCAFSTIVFAIVVETLRAMLLRFILVQRRHVHIETAKRKREADRELRKQALQARLASAGDGSPQALPEPLSEKDPVVDIDENAVEANKLIDMGMWVVWVIGIWLIWADVLPALKALDKQPIFPSRLLVSQPAPAGPVSATSKTNGEQVAAESELAPNPFNPTGMMLPPPSAEKELTAVTYADLLLFLLITAVTIAAARSLPSALEMIFLNQLPFDRSVRYASKSLLSYFVILIGMVLAFGTLSIGWSNVQWLVTALTFGLAFGLQEIFANFVAGIILMFERPMRIGDWVTIDDYTGMVSKIRTRATTLVNFDRKEYVIPNKDFITGRLVNWTLSDTINRVEIRVGIAYGSDVDKAKQLLLETCEAHPKIVSEPETSVTFQEFGDNSLNLVLRTFLRDIDSRLSTIDELNTRINRAFQEAGIEISFPQRDLHIRSIDPSIGAALGGISESRAKVAKSNGR